MKDPDMTASLDLPIRAARETAIAHGIHPDRCDILQNANTLVLRLTDTLVARVVTDRDGPRQGDEWFRRENEIAIHLASHGAPVIPLHPEIPPGPYVHLGFTLNFWQFVTIIPDEAQPSTIGKTLHHCHEILRSYDTPLPRLGIITESIPLLEILKQRNLLPVETLRLLHDRLLSSGHALEKFPHQPLHGDAHLGNFLNTTGGLLLTDWEDTFSGPAEWDVASIIWNARILDEDHATADAIVTAYEKAGGKIHPEALHHSLIARAAVMSAWYPILYPDPSPERKMRLQFRLDWLKG